MIPGQLHREKHSYKRNKQKAFQMQQKKIPTKKENYRKTLELTSIGLTLPSSIAIGLFLGYYLDKWFGTKPWLLIIFLLFGIASGIISLIRGVNKYKEN